MQEAMRGIEFSRQSVHSPRTPQRKLSRRPAAASSPDRWSPSPSSASHFSWASGRNSAFASVPRPPRVGSCQRASIRLPLPRVRLREMGNEQTGWISRSCLCIFRMAASTGCKRQKEPVSACTCRTPKIRHSEDGDAVAYVYGKGKARIRQVASYLKSM